MTRRRGPRTALAGVLALVGMALIGAAPSLSAPGGNNNKGDVWLDNVATVGQDLTECSAPTDITTQAENCESPGDGGPGHSMDPHLACRNIDLWGDKLADSEGTFTIDGWPPSGNKQQAWPGTGANPGTAPWDYEGVADDDTSGQGTSTNDVIAVIDVQQLIANAIANGDTPQQNQGYHFKLQFSQDPQKHKVFWVKCEGPSPSPSPSPSASPESSPTPETSPSPVVSVSPTGGTEGTPTATVSPASGGNAASGGAAVAAAQAAAPATGRAVMAQSLMVAGTMMLVGALLILLTAPRKREESTKA